jgi:predicted esterase
VTARCQLVRRELCGAVPRAGAFVALHADGADSRELLSLCAAIDGARAVIAPQAPRARDPFHSSAAPDDARWRDYSGFAWFRRDELGRPEPASFGDALAQLESLVDELAERGAGPLVLVGHGTGATLALGAALAFPEPLAAVVALRGPRPEIAGWSELHSIPAQLPLLELRESYTDLCGAADRIRHFLDARPQGVRDARGRSQEARQDLLQAHSNR